MLVTKKNENFSCQVCNKNFKSVNILHVHQKTHGDKIYNCYICYKIYKNKAKLNEHLKTHMRENICIVCSKKFSSNDNLLKHQRNLHTVTILPEKLDLHEKTDHTQSSLCSVCGKVVANIERHLETHSEDHFKCNTCDKVFSTRRNLSDHKRNVHNQMKERYQCKECNVSCGRRQDLNRHMISVHTSDSSHTCEQCKKVFSRLDIFDIHSYKCQASSKTLYCETCGKTFKSKRNLKEHKHVRVHLVVANYSCGTCWLKFKSRCLLQMHKNTMHENNHNMT